MLHRGRIQAQGKNIDQSEAWLQENSPTEKEGVEMIERLKAKIPKQEAKLREQAFEKAEKFIKRASQSNGIDAPANITFRVEGSKQERIDIEIKKGKAFIKNHDKNI